MYKEEATMEEKKVSVKELLHMTIDQLCEICVPVKYALEIARPLDQAVRQLKICADALADPEPKPEEGGEADVHV
jgi:hypothetical protein